MLQDCGGCAWVPACMNLQLGTRVPAVPAPAPQVPNVFRNEYTLVDINDEGFVSAMALVCLSPA